MKNIIQQTAAFSKWLENLKDHQGRYRILARIRLAGEGDFGDCKPAGQGLSEMRIDVGPGYRIYFGQIGRMVFLLVAGGDKRTQSRDIAKAKAVWARIKEEGYDNSEN